MTHVVVGVDLTAVSDVVLDRAVRLAGDPDNVLAVHVFEPKRFVSLDSTFAEIAFEEGPSITDAANEIKAALDLMEESLASVCQRHGVSRYQVLEGRTAHELHALADETDADAIVVGASEAHGWAALWTDTTHAVLRGANQDLLAVRTATSNPDGYRRVLVALDTSDAAPEVLRAARRYALEGAELHTVSVVNPVTQVYLGVDHLIDDSSADIEAAITRVCRKRLDEHAASFDIPVDRRHVCHGDRVDQITSLADELDVDLLVIGSHGTRGLALLFGSTPDTVLRHIESDVLAVHLERDADGESREGDDPEQNHAMKERNEKRRRKSALTR